MSTAAKAENNVEVGKGDVVAPIPQPPPAKGWVRFEEENQKHKNTDAAVINTESIQVNLERSISSLSENNTPTPDPKPLRNIELPTATIVEPVRQGFCKCNLNGVRVLFTSFWSRFVANGDVIVTLLPVNTRFPWITPAQFRPELVPEELMAQGLTVSR